MSILAVNSVVPILPEGGRFGRIAWRRRSDSRSISVKIHLCR